MLNGSQPLMLSLDLMDPLCPNLNLESCVSMRMHTKTTQGHRIIVAIKSLSLRQRQYSVYVGQICVIAKRVTGGAENFHCEEVQADPSWPWLKPLLSLQLLPHPQTPSYTPVCQRAPALLCLSHLLTLSLRHRIQWPRPKLSFS
ncbi:uncharacterized [Tachysurus ichikawai]